MVKGNAARRRELGKLRRDAEKADKDRRKHGGASKATPAEARSRLLSDAKRPGSAAVGGAELIGWVRTSLPEGEQQQGRGKRKVGGRGGNARQESQVPIQLVCERYFRTGFCELRRCKHDHTGVNLAHVQGVPPPSDSGDDRGGMLPVVAKPLRQCEAGAKEVYDPKVRRSVSEASPLRFVEWAGVLVFDAENPHVFANYCKRHEASTTRSKGQFWSIAAHRKFPHGCRQAVHTMLLSGQRHARQALAAAAAAREAPPLENAGTAEHEAEGPRQTAPDGANASAGGSRPEYEGPARPGAVPQSGFECWAAATAAADGPAASEAGADEEGEGAKGGPEEEIEEEEEENEEEEEEENEEEEEVDEQEDDDDDEEEAVVLAARQLRHEQQKHLVKARRQASAEPGPLPPDTRPAPPGLPMLPPEVWLHTFAFFGRRDWRR